MNTVDTSEVLGLKMLTMASRLSMTGEEYDAFLHAVADYTKALRMELLDRMYKWAETRRDEEAQLHAPGPVSPVEGVWVQVIEMVRLLKGTLP